MKLETLIKRYAACGYKPRGLERDLEVQSIIHWLYDEYEIFVYVSYMSMNINGTYQKFVGVYRYLQEVYSMFSCEKYFNNPNDAYFDTLRQMQKGFVMKIKYGHLKKSKKNLRKHKLNKITNK